MKKKYTILFFFIFTLSVQSQYEDKYSHYKETFIEQDTIWLDSFPVFPVSLIIKNNNGVPLNDSLFKLGSNYQYVILDSSLLYATLSLHYNTIPFDMFSPVFIHDIQKDLFAESISQPSIQTKHHNQRIQFTGTPGLNTEGSISRGISVGNNQNTGINSNFNLKINGSLSDNLNIRATISDNNIPLQPEGYTQQIQDFDKIYINLYNENFYSTLGDYDLISRRGYFTQFHKKLLGGELQKDFHLNNQDTIRTHSAFAISKGKFNRMHIRGKEGVQGPYTLRGTNNETYIIVLAGSEKVFIDGHLLTRGANHDYTIDYNTGEIYFTVNQPITKDKRILVEFEYSDKNYTRYLLYNKTELHKKNSRFYFSIFSENDAKNQPLLQDLTDHHKSILINAGDSLTDAYALNVDTIEFSNTRVMYKTIDTIHEGENYHIFVHSSNPDSARYAVGFSHVGFGKGNYKLISSTNNGRIYSWTAPKDGVPQGDYAPIRQLISPRSHQLYSAGSSFNIGTHSSLNIEAALSRLDKNTFSSLHNEDDIGLGTLINFKNKLPVRKHGHLLSSIHYYHQSATFTPIERIKSAEFERDWNISQTLAKEEDENSLQLSFEYQGKNKNYIGYQVDHLNYGRSFKGLQNRIHSDYTIKNFSLKTDNSINSGKFETYNTRFIKSYNDLQYKLGKQIAGFKFDLEENQQKHQDDTLMPSSFAFYNNSVYLKNKETETLNYHISYGIRKDLKPEKSSFTDETLAEELSAKISSDYLRNNSFSAQFSLRKLDILNGDQKGEEERTLLTRIRHQFEPARRFLQLQTEYETGSGLERKNHYTFVKIPEGQGTHVWIDYNNNGVQEIGEFELATFQDKANYIRLISKTEEFVSVYHNQISQNLNLNPYPLVHKKDGIIKYLQYFENNTHYTILNKIHSDELMQQVNPFIRTYADTSMINNNIHIRNTTHLNKRNRIWGMHYTYMERHKKNLLTSGFIQQTQYNHSSNARLLLFSLIQLKYRLSFENTQQDYENYALNNYHLHKQSQEISGEYSTTSNLNVLVAYLYSESHNKSGDEEGVEHNIGASLSGSTQAGTQIQFKANYIHFQYNSNINSSLAYNILKGFIPGENITWGISFYRMLEQGIEINLSYEGRKPESLKAIHTGNVTMRANF